MTVSEWKCDVRNEVSRLNEALRESYGLHNAKWCETYSWNATLRADDGENEYCVKIYNTESGGCTDSVDSIQSIAELQLELFQAGCDLILAPMRSTAGTLVTRCARFWVTVYDWVSAFEFSSLSEDSAQSADVACRGGAVLARFHRFTKKMQCGSQLKIPLHASYALGLKDWAIKSEELWNEVEVMLSNANTDALLTAQLRKARRTCRDFLACRPALLQESFENKFLIHGDYRPENVLLCTPNEERIVDLDMIHLDLPEMDVASAALHFSGPRWLYGPRDWSSWRAFIQGYNSSMKSDGIDLIRLNQAALAVILKSLSMSFKPEQVRRRFSLLQDFIDCPDIRL